MPKQELTTTKKNEVALGGGLKLQNQLMLELEKANEEIGAGFTDYGKTCAINCIAGLVSLCKSKGIDFGKIDGATLKIKIRNIGFTELNYASIPSEIYFDIRKQYKKGDDGTSTEYYAIDIKPQGAGNEKLVRKYGVGVKRGSGLHNAILVREGDEFIMPQFNGLEMTPPIYKPQLKNANNKIIAVCYPLEKEDGKVEYLIAPRESVKANLVAMIRQNTLYTFTKKTKNQYGKEFDEVDTEARDKFYDEVNKKAEKMTLDEMLADEELWKYINPTYTSGGSKEQMVLRKMKNNALKNYPKEYDNSYIANAVKDMFEENDESVLEKRNVVAKVEKELDEDLNDDVAEDFDVDEGKVVDVEATPKQENAKPSQADDDVPF